MVKVRVDLTGKKFGRLTVLQQTEDHIDPSGGKRACWLCECDCHEHNQVIVLGQSLTNGSTRSCGCLQKEIAAQNCKTQFKRTNIYDLKGEYGILWTSNTNEEVYFDLENADKILEHSWYEDAFGYAVSRIDGKLMRMHIFLGYKWHDHSNRNKKDNRIENFRPCTSQENIRNHSKRLDNTSGVTGVDWNADRQRWRVRIYDDQKREIFIGHFDNLEKAKIARLQAEAKYYGEFAPQRHLFKQYGIENIEEGDNNNG